MSDYRKLVESAVKAATILAKARFAWFDQPSVGLPRKTERAMTAEMVRQYLVSELSEQLYSAFYLVGEARPATSDSGGPASNADFVHALSQANCGEGSWSAGWCVRALGNDALVIERDGLTLTTPAACFRVAQGAKAARGDVGALRMPKERLGISPGFYLAEGNVEFGKATPESIVRVYWNLRPHGAVSAMAFLTRSLNEREIPFRFKVVGSPERFSRCDACVLYLHGRDFARAAQSIASAYDTVARWVVPVVPALTKALRPGLGLAENPPEGLSFGAHRSTLLADGIVRAHESRTRALDARLGVVVKRLAEAGVSLDTPYLNPDSMDRYALVVAPQRAAVCRVDEQRAANDRHQIAADEAVSAALCIAERLSHSACAHEDRCSWLQNSGDGRAEAGGLQVLGSAFYAGTSGVALFLAEAAHTAGRDDLRNTALGAARQALRLLPRDPARDSWGFYDGWPGVAVASARVGRLLHDAELVLRTRRCVEQLLVLRADAREFDLVSGSAGGILALLALAELLDLPACHGAAKALANTLCERAAPSKSGLSWRSPRQRRGRNLTGYSHGTSGVAHALLELHAVTGERRYAEVASQAFEYERRWYSPRERNWPDFRIEQELPARAGQPAFFQTAWCHGAPGIALSRLRARALTGDSRYESEAVEAIGTTERAVEAALAAGNAESSLCHGLAGNTDVLLCADAIAATNVDRRELVDRAARRLARDALAQLEPSAAGATPPHPGLMLGAAGIGHLLLRVGRPATPSCLRPGSALAKLVA